MSRFARLTRNGTDVFVRPEDVRSIAHRRESDKDPAATISRRRTRALRCPGNSGSSRKPY